MTLTAEDRVALILGRTIIRAEALQAENEQLRVRLAELEEQPPTNPPEKP